MAGYSVTYSVVDNATKQIDAINRRITAMRAPMERMSRSVSRFVDVSGLRKVAQGFEWIGKTAATVFRTLSQIVPVMGAITGAASIAGMVKLVNSYADWSHQLVQNADDIGTTTQQLQQFQDATRLAGGNAGDMTSSLKALHTNLADFAIGRGNFAEVGQMASYLGVNLRDANGQIRTAADLMPELIRKIAALPDPANRARAATEMFGAEGSKLVETFRQSHQSFADWFTDAGRYTELTDDQKRSLQEFSEAQGRAATAFDHLGQQISVVLARDFAPLLNRLSEFVEKHTPEIVAAVDRISQEFTTWLQGVDWSKVEAGINSMIEGLKWVINNLDTVKTAAEVIAGLFAVKWAVGMVASIAQVTAALGSVAGGAAASTGGAGLLGALGSVAALATALATAYGAKQALDAGSEKVERGVFGDARVDERKRMQDEGAKQFWQQVPSWLGGTGGATGGLGALWDRAMKGPEAIRRQSAAPANLSLPADTAARGGALPGDYSWGDYGTRANNPGNMNYADWEGASGKFSYTDPHTGGAHTMATFASMQEGVAASIKLMQRNQAKYGNTLAGALHGWAENPYVNKLGMDPSAPFDVSKADPNVLADMLQAQYKQEGRHGTHSVTRDQIMEGIQRSRGVVQIAQAGPPPLPPVPPAAPPVASAQAAPPPAPPVPAAPVTPPVPPAPSAPAAPAAPVTVPPPTPVNGSVNVDITHKNAPPNSAVTATGTGSVNVAPVRVEHQDMAGI